MSQKIYVTADSHYGHSNILKYCHRPFLAPVDAEALARFGGSWHQGTWKGVDDDPSKWRISHESVEMMNDALVNCTNAIVGEDDILWHLGDFCFGSKHNYYDNARRIRDRIKCQNLYIVWGNHDQPDKIRNLFSGSFDKKELVIDGEQVIFCHYALAIWNKSHRKATHCYGHSHSEAEFYLDAKFPGRRSMDVGVDNAAKILGEYRPFSWEEIKDYMKDRPGHNLGDHHINPNAPTEESLQ